MNDQYIFPGQFRCMYCKEDLDPEAKLALPNEGQVDLKCFHCKATWKFWASVQLNHKLVHGGIYNKKPIEKQAL